MMIIIIMFHLNYSHIYVSILPVDIQTCRSCDIHLAQTFLESQPKYGNYLNVIFIMKNDLNLNFLETIFRLTPLRI